MTVDDCFIEFIEHVEITVKAKASNDRGDIELYLTSPQGPQATTILGQRLVDLTSSSFDFRFMSVHQWGESANGEWTLVVFDSWGGNGQ